MIQNFAVSNCVSSFVDARQPRLLFASKIDPSLTIYPRALHKHDDFFELLFIRSGTGRYILDETHYSVKAGDLILCNPGVLHDEDASSNANLNILSVAITDLHISGLPANHLLDSRYAPVFPTGESAEMIDGLLMSIFSLLAETSESSAEACQHLTAGLVSSLLTLIERHCRTENSTLSKGGLVVKEVTEYLNAHYNEDIALEDIANAFHLSLYHLVRSFKEHTGYSPKQYILRRRLGEAQTLLISTSLPVMEISAMVGYSDHCQFDRMFSKYIGISPSGYRTFYRSR